MNFKELSLIKSDYYSAIADYGFTHTEVREQVENHSDLITTELKGVFLADSEIDGQGMFTDHDIIDGDLICVGSLAGCRTMAGRYVNHHPDPNGFYILIGDDVWMTAKRDIKKGEELTVDYRQALSLKIQRDPVKTTDIDIFRMDRKMVAGPMADAYDLLCNEDHLSRLSLQERIVAFEQKMMKYPQAKIEPRHEFIEGLYRREITFPAYTMATGQIHPTDHMDVMLSGEMLIATQDGFKHLKGPMSFVSNAGSKKAGFTLTEVVWQSYHPTKCTTIEEVEKEIFTDDFLEIDVGGLI